MTFQTPLKKTSLPNSRTADSAYLSVSHLQASSIDFKTKTYELMDEIVEIKKRQKEYIIKISELQNELQKQRKENKRLLWVFGCNKPQQLIEKFGSIESKNQDAINKSLKVYKKQTQQLLTKMNELRVFNKISKLNHHSHVQNPKNEQLSDNKEEIQLLKGELKNLLEENSGLQDTNENLQQQLSRSITKFQCLESIITQKINQYSQQIEAYEKELENSKKIIQDFQKKQHKSEKIEVNQFSFGEEDEEINKQKQTKNQDQNTHNDILCYQASIDGLMEENRRLKKVLQGLYRLKDGQTITQQTQRQIQIMERIISLNNQQQESQ